jgi:hypothetical protein
MPARKRCYIAGMILLMLMAAPRLSAQAGPLFQMDDPTPVDIGHFSMANDGLP